MEEPKKKTKIRCVFTSDQLSYTTPADVFWRVFSYWVKKIAFRRIDHSSIARMLINKGVTHGRGRRKGAGRLSGRADGRRSRERRAERTCARASRDHCSPLGSGLARRALPPGKTGPASFKVVCSRIVANKREMFRFYFGMTLCFWFFSSPVRIFVTQCGNISCYLRRKPS